MAHTLVGRLYNLGNDYPSDIGCRPVSGDWVASSYLDGIYTQAEEGFVKGEWNKYYTTVLPQEEWTPAESGRQFPAEYAVTYVATESAHNEAVKEYDSDGIDAVVEAGVVEPTGLELPSPYIKQFPKI